MARTRYLADTSVFARLPKSRVAAAFAPLAAAGLVGVSSPVMFELGYSARSPQDYQALADRLSSFPLVATTDGDHRRALAIQAALATESHHRAVSLVDGLVAAVAESRDLIVLHYDADFELVAHVTGQAQEWIVARGLAD
ncbi:MAG: PIN domain nuclease [Acidimicrobiales bacterium]